MYLLHQLESLLDDVDNARDFHTIGAWPTLLAFLQPHMHIDLRTAAAWAVGTAVKNTYDYQLWTLETVPGVSGTGGDSVGGDASSDAAQAKSAVNLLVDMLVADATAANNAVPDTAPASSASVSVSNPVHDLQKRALYALSSATRGNLDVQDHTMRVSDGHMQSVYLDNLLSLAGKYTSTPAELQRKVWATVSDLIEERAYIRKELQAETAILLARHSANVNRSSGESIGVADEMAAVEAVQHTILLGDFLLSEHWLVVAADAGLHCSGLLSASVAANTDSSSVATLSDSDVVSVHASLRSILTYFTAVLQDKPEMYGAESAARWQIKLHNVVRTVRDARFDVSQYESLRENADALAALIGLLDQGANSAVF